MSKFDTRNNPLGLWQFDGNLSDSSGNGFDLSVAAGIPVYTDVLPNRRGINMLAPTQLTSTEPSLNILGDVTVLGIVQLNGPFLEGLLAGWGIDGADTEPRNSTYIARFNTSTAPYTMGWFQESGAGVNHSFVSPTTAGSITLPPVHNIIFAGFTRVSNVVTLNLNGRNIATSGVLPAPTGGGDAQFYVGQFPGSQAYNGLIMSLKVLNIGYSLAQFEEEYNYTLGPAYGTV